MPQQMTSGFTPARAGKSRVRRIAKYLLRIHPRACGEKSPMARCSPSTSDSPPRVREKVLLSPVRGSELDSPPRVRGKVLPAFDPQGGRRFTPARAGKRGPDLRERQQSSRSRAHSTTLGDERQSQRSPFRGRRTEISIESCSLIIPASKGNLRTVYPHGTVRSWQIMTIIAVGS